MKNKNKQTIRVDVNNYQPLCAHIRIYCISNVAHMLENIIFSAPPTMEARRPPLCTRVQVERYQTDDSESDSVLLLADFSGAAYALTPKQTLPLVEVRCSSVVYRRYASTYTRGNSAARQSFILANGKTVFQFRLDGGAKHNGAPTYRTNAFCTLSSRICRAASVVGELIYRVGRENRFRKPFGRRVE